MTDLTALNAALDSLATEVTTTTTEMSTGATNVDQAAIDKITDRVKDLEQRLSGSAPSPVVPGSGQLKGQAAPGPGPLPVPPAAAPAPSPAGAPPSVAAWTPPAASPAA